MARHGGWRRLGSPGRFRYVDARGKRITDPRKLARIEALVIPPAWREVRIAARPSANRQATGLDAAGRRQYLYREDYRAVREQEKYDRLTRFAERRPELRAVMSEHMELGPYEREWVAAVAVRRSTWAGCGSAPTATPGSRAHTESPR